MFSRKQLSTIKKVLDEETRSKEDDEDQIIRYKGNNLILATERLQEIYKEVCIPQTSYNSLTTSAANLIDEMSLTELKNVIKELLSSNEKLSTKLNDSYKIINLLKESETSKYLPKIQRLEDQVKKHSMLEETWQKSRDALIKENKILLDQVNKNERRIKGIRKLAEKKMKKKFEKFKKKISESGNKDSEMKEGEHGCPAEAKGEMKIKRSSSEIKKKVRKFRKSTSNKCIKKKNFSERMGRSMKIFKTAISDKKSVEEKERKIQNLTEKIADLEKKSKEKLKSKLSEAYDRFEEEKGKIMKYFKNEVKNLREKLENVEIELKIKSSEVDELKELRKEEKKNFEERMINLEEERHEFEIDKGKDSKLN